MLTVLTPSRALKLALLLVLHFKQINLNRQPIGRYRLHPLNNSRREAAGILEKINAARGFAAHQLDYSRHRVNIHDGIYLLSKLKKKPQLSNANIPEGTRHHCRGWLLVSRVSGFPKCRRFLLRGWAVHVFRLGFPTIPSAFLRLLRISVNSVGISHAGRSIIHPTWEWFDCVSSSGSRSGSGSG